MPSIREENPRSFTDYVALIESLRKGSKSLWFRGCGRRAYALIPTFYRHKNIKSREGLETLERQVMNRFRQRSIPLLSRPLENDWDTLFFMQHYGIPTRLLDWTENPFIAFYFAVTTCPFTIKKKGRAAPMAFSTDAAIWVLDPIKWNNHALSQQGYDRGVLTPGDAALHPYKPLTTYNEIPIHPVALYGAHNSPRIVAQRGVFTIFGQNTNPMEDAYARYDFPRDCLLKITFDRTVIPDMRSSDLLSKNSTSDN